MSQIKHAQQINLFMEYARRNRLTSYDRILWIALFHCANRLAMGAENHEWPDDFFQVSNSEIYDWAGLEERAIRNSRNRLKQMGLIDFQKGDGKRHDPFYQIRYLTVIGYKIVPGSVGDSAENNNTGSKFAADGVGGSVGDSVGDTVTDAVGGMPQTGSKFAADGAADPIPCTPNPGIYNKYKQGTGNSTGKATTKPMARTEVEEYTARARRILSQQQSGYSQGYPQGDGFEGLVDMSGDFEGEAEFVPLPWDMRG